MPTSGVVVATDREPAALDPVSVLHSTCPYAFYAHCFFYPGPCFFAPCPCLQKSHSLEQRVVQVTAELEMTQKRAQAASDRLSDHMAVFGAMEAESFRMKVK